MLCFTRHVMTWQKNYVICIKLLAIMTLNWQVFKGKNKCIEVGWLHQITNMVVAVIRILLPKYTYTNSNVNVYSKKSIKRVATILQV